MANEVVLWPELYRPKTIEDCILPKYIKETFQKYVDDEEIPNLFLYGSSGIGKTTVARALCEQVGCDYIIINGSDENGIDTFRNKIKTYASSVSFSGKRKVIIVDEADYLNAQSVQPALRGAIEEFHKNCTFIFTCNYPQRIIKELRSRFSEVEFKVSKEEYTELLAASMKRIFAILKENEVVFKPEVVGKFVKKFYPDLRKTLNELQKFAKAGVIDERILTVQRDAEISTLIPALKAQDYQKVRAWVGANSNCDSQQIFRKVYDGVADIIDPKDIPKAIILIAKYQYQASMVADQEINMAAFLAEFMYECSLQNG